MGIGSIASQEEASAMQVVYRTKVSADGYDIKYNSRLFAILFSQFQGSYYIDTFAPVAKMDSIRLVLAIAASKR